ncbi:hypothetical protein EKO04_008849 [Ascochyta lentis]|uniref:Uncharacterized protein n=1 Tax=Ascochyta lentis TaxID=205686 RepID=A0A8H7J0G0_9PLEO|nr:hypothetical protein EKO04_008849 [Ascochyta lentis]
MYVPCSFIVRRAWLVVGIQPLRQLDAAPLLVTGSDLPARYRKRTSSCTLPSQLITPNAWSESVTSAYITGDSLETAILRACSAASGMTVNMSNKKAKGNFAVALSNGDPRDTKCTLGPNAPTERLDFGSWGNYTAVELLVFFPKIIRNFDVARRLTRNGLGISTMANIINAFRMWDKHPAPPSSIFKKVQAAMRDHPDYQNWKMRDVDKEDLSNHDPTDLTLEGFVLQCVRFPANGWKAKQSVPFKSLAVDVQSFPEGDDALDLTRCVRYAADHPEEIWNYPEDFERLTLQLGGPAKILPEHYDATVSHRWATWHLKDHEEFEWKPADSDIESDSGCSDEDADSLFDDVPQEDVADNGLASAKDILSLSRRVLRSARVLDGQQHHVSLVEPMLEAHQPTPAHSTHDIESRTGESDEQWYLQSSQDRTAAGPTHPTEFPSASMTPPWSENQIASSISQDIQSFDTRTGSSFGNRFLEETEVPDMTATIPDTLFLARNVWQEYSIDAMFAAEGLGEAHNSPTTASGKPKSETDISRHDSVKKTRKDMSPHS